MGWVHRETRRAVKKKTKRGKKEKGERREEGREREYKGLKRMVPKAALNPTTDREKQQGDNESEKANWVREIQIQIQ